MPNLNNLDAYELVKEENLSDISSTGYLFRHKKSGAKIAVISNDDDNKVFSINFRTTPDDKTGVPHIIEHTVLCGSEKYPLKDPFIDLVKGSLNTFLNAMTFHDKTMYPIASYNEQDFKNLMDVYLDAVFAPNLLKEEKIFKQEGWHYELADADSDLEITGVVYNEMKGAYSSADRVLSNVIDQSLFPDNTYSKDSGGNPENIPDLTYEKYLEFYHKYYHPSNSYIYLYGDMDVEERLIYLDKEYLSKYDVLEMNTEIPMQKGYDARIRIEDDYPVASDDSTDKATYLSYNWVVADGLDALKYLAIDVLDYALISAPGAPVMQALLDAGIGEDVYSNYSTGNRQSSFSIVAKNANVEDEEKFIQIIEDTLKEQVKNGINKNSLLASINSNEFRFREADFGQFPKGLLYGIQVMDSWLFDDNAPYLHLQCLDNYAFLKEQIQTDYFEKLLEEVLINNTHSSIVVLKPNPGKNVREEEAFKKKMADIKAGLSAEEIERIIRETKELHEYQETEDDPKLKECIPMLTREDLRKEVLPISNIESEYDGIKFVHHNYETNGINYISLFFNADDIALERVSALSLFTSILGYVDTQNYTYLELSNAINIFTGGISSLVSTNQSIKNENKMNLRLIVKTKVLTSELEKALSLIEEMVFSSKLDDVKRISEIVGQIKARMQVELSSSGNMTAMNRAFSYFSKGAVYQEYISNIEFYRYICKVEKQLKTNPEEVVKEMISIRDTFFTRDRLLISYTANETVFADGQPKLAALMNKFPQSGETFTAPVIKMEKKNEAFTDASQIQYVVRAGDFKKHGYDINGALRILKLILSYDYLWNNIRVKGGAYGCSSIFTRFGECAFTSYRDPNLAKTIEVYEGLPEYVKNFDTVDRQMTGYVIGTFGNLDTPLNPEAKGKRSMSVYFSEITIDELQKERDEVLNATQQDIRDLAPMLQAVIDDGYLCVVGNENAINENKDIFMKVSKLYE